MSDPSEVICSLPPECTGSANDSEPAPTVPGVAPHEGAHFDPPQDTASSSYLDDLWRNALDNYGLQRPTDVTEIHVFRVILQSTWDKNEGTRSVTRAGPMSDPFQTLERIIDGWSDLEIEEHDQSWRLSPINSACTWSSTNELSSPAYVLTRKGNPFHFLRPHGVLEVVWGHRQWTTAIALPRWINRYNCLGLFAQVCGPMLTPSCAIWCDNTRLSEELIECSIGSFVQVYIKAVCSDLVRIDLQASLQRSIHLLHLPGKSLHDDLVKMTVFVPQGVTCFSGATFECTSPFENWQTVLREEGHRIYPGRNPDTMIFHRVHKAIEEVCPIFEPALKHFILADAEEQEHTRTVVFAIFTSCFEFFGACHWTPTTRVWDILDLCGGERGWLIYHNNQRLRHQRVSVHHGDFFACYERGECTPLLQEDHPSTDIAQGWVANAPSQVHGDEAGSVQSVPLGAGSVRNDGSPTFETTGDPLLLIGRRGGYRRQNDRVVSFDLDAFQ